MNIVSIDKDNMTYTCDDGNEYPLTEGLENMTVDELKIHVGIAQKLTSEFMKLIEKEHGKATDD